MITLLEHIESKAAPGSECIESALRARRRAAAIPQIQSDLGSQMARKVHDPVRPDFGGDASCLGWFAEVAVPPVNRRSLILQRLARYSVHTAP